MIKPLYLVDTCSFVRQFRESSYAGLFDDLILKGQFVLSAVVAMELYAGTKSKEQKRALDQLADHLARVGLLVTPDFRDFQYAGLILRSYAGRKGNLLLSPHFRDILISLNAVRAGAAVVTENSKDFERWQKEIRRSLRKELHVLNLRTFLPLRADDL